MTNEEKATYLARELFALGDFGAVNDRTQRIEFKGGIWPDSETDLGGMCEGAMVSFFVTRLRELEKL